MCEKCSIKEKDVLDLAWNYFQQHAQQRIGYFNFFVVFSVLMTTGLMTTFQEKFSVHFVGIAIGLMLSLISFVFWKIDDRNKYLTKIGENAIKEMEKKYHFDTQYDDLRKLQIFSLEEATTDELVACQKNNFCFSRQISHSRSFNILFTVFFLVGILGAIASAYYQIEHGQSKAPLKEKSDNEIWLARKLDETNKQLEALRSLCTEKKENKIIIQNKAQQKNRGDR